jgi:hypothetical protein
MQTFDGKIASTSWTWIYLVFPWVGALAAVLLYEIIFKRATIAVESHDENARDEGLLEAQ